MPPAPGNFTKVTFNYSLYGPQTASWSLWFSQPSPAAPGGMAAIAAGAGDAIYVANLQSYLKGTMNPGMIMKSITYRAYQPDSDTLFDQATKTYGDAGTNAVAMAPQLALVCSLRTAGFGRAYRGRIYVPTAISPSTSTGQVLTAGKTAMANAFKAYLQAWDAGGSTPVLVSRSRGTDSALTYIEVDGVMDTQRRRRDKIVDLSPTIAAL